MHNRYFSISLNQCHCFQYNRCRSRFTSNHFYSKFKNNSSVSGNSWVSSGCLCGLYWIIFEPPKTIKITWKDLKWLQMIFRSSFKFNVRSPLMFSWYTKFLIEKFIKLVKMLMIFQCEVSNISNRSLISQCCYQNKIFPNSATIIVPVKVQGCGLSHTVWLERTLSWKSWTPYDIAGLVRIIYYICNEKPCLLRKLSP